MPGVRYRDSNVYQEFFNTMKLRLFNKLVISTPKTETEYIHHKYYFWRNKECIIRNNETLRQWLIIVFILNYRADTNFFKTSWEFCLFSENIKDYWSVLKLSLLKNFCGRNFIHLLLTLFRCRQVRVNESDILIFQHQYFSS